MAKDYKKIYEEQFGKSNSPNKTSFTLVNSSRILSNAGFINSKSAL